jgi:L-ascorbate metabolism protein UlaG (beta-lactamase superfamily)
MKIQLIRSATLKVLYSGNTILIDPCLAAKHSRPSYARVSKNPLVDLPFAPYEVISNVDLVLISHLHSDHFDPLAKEILNKDIEIVCQPEDEREICSNGFRNVIPLGNTITWNDIQITPTACQHGEGKVLDEMGTAMGFIIKATNEPTVYWVGDTIINDSIINTVRDNNPDIIITHSCGAKWGDGVLIVMDAAQTIEMCKLTEKGIVIATHMESFDHSTISRAYLREYAEKSGIINKKLLIPYDGETLEMQLGSA